MTASADILCSQEAMPKHCTWKAPEVSVGITWSYSEPSGSKELPRSVTVGAESRDPDLQEYLKVKSRAGEQGAQHPGSTHSHCANHSPMRSAGWNSRGNSCTQLGLFLPGSITPQIPNSHYVPKPRGTGEVQPPKRQHAHTTSSCQHCRESGERQPAKSTQ